jgi:hypothetical protein
MIPTFVATLEVQRSGREGLSIIDKTRRIICWLPSDDDARATLITEDPACEPDLGEVTMARRWNNAPAKPTVGRVHIMIDRGPRRRLPVGHKARSKDGRPRHDKPAGSPVARRVCCRGFIDLALRVASPRERTNPAPDERVTWQSHA